ncbi:hypothetical protein QOT17_003477 [Balamuthia mandrillaris]
MRINFKYLSALFLTAFVLIVAFVAMFVPWYEYEVHNYSFGKEYTYKHNSGQLKTMYDLILTSLVLAVVFGVFLASILTIFSFGCFRAIGRWRKKLRVPAILLGCLLVPLVMAAWLLLFWHPAALSHDLDCDVSDTPCDTFMKSGDWGPREGFWMSLVATIPAILAAIFTCVGGHPAGRLHGYNAL